MWASCPGFHSNLKFQKGILLNSKCRNFSEFSFEIHSESRKVPMKKAVPFFKTFTTIFYFKIFKCGKVLFGRVKAGIKLNYIWIKFKPPPPRIVPSVPTCQRLLPPLFWAAAPHASPCPPLLGWCRPPAGRGRRPGPSQPLPRGVPTPIPDPPSLFSPLHPLKKALALSSAPFSPPLHHISLSSTARKLALSLVTHCPSNLAGETPSSPE
jgi:hypothetical protein